jgi:putative transcriptional regulator
MNKVKKLVRRDPDDAKSGKAAQWARQTQFILQRNGSMRRLVTRSDGTVEKDEIIPAKQWELTAARAATGLSQAEFAQLLGVSKRTLQEWEHGRKKPSGAARVLLKIAARHPDILKELAA